MNSSVQFPQSNDLFSATTDTRVVKYNPGAAGTTLQQLSYTANSALPREEARLIIFTWLESQTGIRSSELHIIPQEYQLQAVTVYYVLRNTKLPLLVTEAERARLHINLDDYFGIQALHWNPLSWLLLQNEVRLESLVDHRGLIVVDQQRLQGWSCDDMTELRMQVEDAVDDAQFRGAFALHGEGVALMKEVAEIWYWNVEKLDARRRGKDGIPIPLRYWVFTPPSSPPYDGCGKEWLYAAIFSIYSGELPTVVYHPRDVGISNGNTYDKLLKISTSAYREVATLHNPYMQGLESLISVGSDYSISLPAASPADLHHFSTKFEQLWSENAGVEFVSIKVPGVKYSSAVATLRICTIAVEEAGATANFEDGSSSSLLELEFLSTPPPNAHNIIEGRWKEGYFITLWGHYNWNLNSRESVAYCRDTLKFRDWTTALAVLGTE